MNLLVEFASLSYEFEVFQNMAKPKRHQRQIAYDIAESKLLQVSTEEEKKLYKQFVTNGCGYLSLRMVVKWIEDKCSTHPLTALYDVRLCYDVLQKDVSTTTILYGKEQKEQRGWLVANEMSCLEIRCAIRHALRVLFDQRC